MKILSIFKDYKVDNRVFLIELSGCDLWNMERRKYYEKMKGGEGIGNVW